MQMGSFGLKSVMLEGYLSIGIWCDPECGACQTTTQIRGARLDEQRGVCIPPEKSALDADGLCRLSCAG